MIALDTSVAVPLLVSVHRDHAAVVAWWNKRDVALSGHAVAETYSVLTRLPAGLRHTPSDAARLIGARFGPPFTLVPDTAARLPEILAELGVVGGAVYDAMVALAALEHDAELATRDARARRTYEAIGARVIVVAA